MMAESFTTGCGTIFAVGLMENREGFGARES